MRKLFLIFALFYWAQICAPTFAAQQLNPRTVATITREDNTSRQSSVVGRSTSPRATQIRNPQSVISSRSATTNARTAVAPRNTVARSATSARSATATVARSATSPRTQTVAGNRGRATAVYNDLTKMGTGYNDCSTAYNTCMDQFCALSSDTYRRCYCSERLAEFQETETNLAEAKLMLMQFEDQNLNVVDKTAAEVVAMQTATVGEDALRADATAAGNRLTEIGDLLSGATTAAENDFSFNFVSLDFDDIWSGGNAFDIFGENNADDMLGKQGVDLYNAAHAQCAGIVRGSCSATSVADMVRNSYTILITQDCNLYQKKIDAEKEKVTQVVRMAEKELRNARLEDYRAHNTDDMNECITGVKTAMLGDNVCGADYKKCLDPTGKYINVNTGEAIYSTELFELTSVDDNAIAQFLDSKKQFVTGALDRCRDLNENDAVWTEFKRAATIEIAQAQDEKIETVKSDCVSIITECYDTQTGALRELSGALGTTATGAIGAAAARAQCADQVDACSNLYDGGLDALVNFVAAVDNVKIAAGCKTAMVEYAKELCTPPTGDMGYPYGCRLRSADELRVIFQERANTYCPNDISADIQTTINEIVATVEEYLEYELADACEDGGYGAWVDAAEATGRTKSSLFYTNVMGGNDSDTSRGVCVVNDMRFMCDEQNKLTGNLGYATYDVNTNQCTLSEKWYEYKCLNTVGGYWLNGQCYVSEEVVQDAKDN